MRYFFNISYLGMAYNGWQSQPNGKGVQEMVEQALSSLFRKKISITGSGRTDTGVHCESQWFHADIDQAFVPVDLVHRLNSFLPRDISINDIRPVRPDASARYDATARSYRYVITLRKDPLLTGRALHWFKPLDIGNMQEAAGLLKGTHDFECFSKVKTDVDHFRCTVKRAVWKKNGHMLVFEITANRFLRGMVRAIVGTLLDVGTGKITVQDFARIIEGKDRKKAGMNVAPEGLYLVKVDYPGRVFLKNQMD
ncbi:MAG: tRNA pseudouridine(38-40) synthase TruA [Bacteroidota bacterium]